MNKRIGMYAVLGVCVIAAGAAIAWIGARDESSNNSNISVIAQSNTNSAHYNIGQSLVYVRGGSSGGQDAIVKHNIEAQTDTTLYAFNNNIVGVSPNYLPYGQVGVYIRQAGEEDRNIVVDSSGIPLGESYIPDSDVFLPSQSGKHIALTRWDLNLSDGYQFVIRDTASGTEASVATGVIGNELAAIYHPLRWSADEQYVYANIWVETEGFPVGLLKINRQTMAVERVPAIDAEKAVSLVMDGQMRAYGIVNGSFDYFEGSGSSQILKIDIASGEVQKYQLRSTQTRRLWSVNDAGTYLAYSCSFSETSSDLCMLNLQDGEETRITTNKVVDGDAMWSGDTLAYTEHSINPTANGSDYVIKVYDASTKNVIESIPAQTGAIIRLIGWMQ